MDGGKCSIGYYFNIMTAWLDTSVLLALVWVLSHPPFLLIVENLENGEKKNTTLLSRDNHSIVLSLSFFCPSHSVYSEIP